MKTGCLDFDELEWLLDSTETKIEYDRIIDWYLKNTESNCLEKLNIKQMIRVEPYLWKYDKVHPGVEDLIATRLDDYWSANFLDDECNSENIIKPISNKASQIKKIIIMKNGKVPSNGGLKKGEIALTFDDGPHPKITSLILDILDHKKIKANFFMIGKQAENNKEMVERVFNAGHMIGSHTYTHSRLREIIKIQNGKDNPDDVEKAWNDEIIKGDTSIRKIIDNHNKFFRYPYGKNIKGLDEKFLKNNWATFLWNIDSEDWKHSMHKNICRNLYKKVADDINKLGNTGGVILFHDIHRITVSALKAVLDDMSEKGFTFIVFSRE